MKNMHIYAGVAGAILVAAVFAIVQQAAATVTAPGWAVVDADNSGAVSKSANTATLFLKTNDNIPNSQSQIAADSFIAGHAVVGFAWTDGSGKLFAVTIHPTAVPKDSFKLPNIWHAHTATVTAGTGSDLCVVSIDSSPTVGIGISGDTMTVQVTKSALPFAPEDVALVTGFVIDPDTGCVSGLGANLTTP